MATVLILRSMCTFFALPGRHPPQTIRLSLASARLAEGSSNSKIVYRFLIVSRFCTPCRTTIDLHTGELIHPNRNCEWILSGHTTRAPAPALENESVALRHDQTDACLRVMPCHKNCYHCWLLLGWSLLLSRVSMATGTHNAHRRQASNSASVKTPGRS